MNAGSLQKVTQCVTPYWRHWEEALVVGESRWRDYDNKGSEGIIKYPDCDDADMNYMLAKPHTLLHGYSHYLRSMILHAN